MNIIRYLRLRTGDPLPDIRDLSPFKAIVIIDGLVDPQWQADTSRWLADSGCRFMMAWGNCCSSWDDSVDIANIEQFDASDISADDFILTTWHEDEPLRDVFEFAKFAAHHPTVTMPSLLLLHISAVDRRDEFEALYEAV